MQKERLCVVMPVYNEEAAIGPVLEKWDNALAALGIDYEIRPYNDGSKDGSLHVMHAVAAGRPRISVRNKQNGGHGNTILTGCREAAADGFDWIFQVDSDDEMGPEKFRDLWVARNDVDFLVGIRDGRRQALPRKIMSFVSRLCVRIFYGKSVWDVNTPYRLMRVSAFRDFFENIPLTSFAPNVILTGLAAGLRCREFRVPQHDRTTGEVSIKKWKLLKAAAKSFWQTITFALCFKAVGREPMVKRALRLGVVALCLAGIGFTALCMARASLLTFAATALAAIIVLLASRNGRMLTRVSRFLDKHWILALLGVAFAGIILRAAAYRASPDLAKLQGGDCRALWNWAGEMAGGVFPDAKSWLAPGLWALVIRVFGTNLAAAVGLNILVQAATSALLFVVARRIFGNPASGVFAAGAYFLSPLFAGFAFHMYSEHVYYLLVMLLFMLVYDWRARHSMLTAAALPILTFAVLWTRGEGGLIFWGIIPILYLSEMICDVKNRKCTTVALAVFVAIVGVGITAGMAVNSKYHGTDTFLCSDDNWWPRLYGSNYRYDGNITKMHIQKNGKTTNVDKELILARYAKDSGRQIHLEASTCPTVLVPYIKKEIGRRWQAMSWCQKIKLIARKQRHTWCPERHIGWAKPYGKGPSFVLKFVFAFGACVVFWGWCRRMFLLKTADLAGAMVLLAPVMLCCGIAAVVSVAEAHPRYGQIAAALVFPLYGAGWLGRLPGSTAKT